MSIPGQPAAARVKPQYLEIAGPSGVLEAMLEAPEPYTGQRVAVLCHPHPLHGGSMTNKVVHTLSRTFNTAGVATLRFNFRGVGKSAGHFDEGRGETADALAAIDYLLERWPDAQLWLAGFSFGAAVALRAATQRVAACLVTVAPAMPVQVSALPNCPWLLLQGEQDEVVDCATVVAWVKQLMHPPTLKIMAGAGHYFHGRLTDLRNNVSEWLNIAVQKNTLGP